MIRAAQILLGLFLAACGAPQSSDAQADAASANGSKCASLERRPVLMVHGSGLDSSYWAGLRSALEQRGYPGESVRAIDLRPNDGDNVRAAAEQIAPAAIALLSDAAAMAGKAGCRAPRKIDIVSHSMGAFSSRWYAARISPERVHTWIGLAPASHGTDALCGHDGAGNRQMCPAFASSGVQADLNGSKGARRDETPFGLGADSHAARIAPDATRAIRYFTVRLDPDQWIEPADSAALDGAGDGATQAWPPGVRETSPGNLLWHAGGGHDALPSMPDVIELVLSLLQTPRT